MKKNLGTADRTIRVMASLFIAALILAGTLTGISAWVLGALAFVFTFTSFIGVCPIYLALGITTKKTLERAR
jgi:hypothetical protein